MERYNLEEIFCDSGVPEFTFIEPSEYTKTKVALRTKGRGLVIEGPSGIGKTTCIQKILEDINLQAAFLSARKSEDIELIKLLTEDPKNWGVVIIDDFHYLSIQLKNQLSDILKVLADESREDIKLVLIGINRAGECLVQVAPDLNNRIDTIKFEANPTYKILELIDKGESRLNIKFACRQELAEKAAGSFHIAQMLCKEGCILGNITETQTTLTTITTPIQRIVDSKMEEIARVFENVLQTFAVGNRNRRGGRAPYLRLLIWLSTSSNGSLQMDAVMANYPILRASIKQIAEKGYLTQLINKSETIQKVMYYDENSKILAIEDPKFIFYLQNKDWEAFAKGMGFRLVDYQTQYDFALSFAGEKRQFAEALFHALVTYNYSVFYDRNNSADTIGKDLKNTLLQFIHPKLLMLWYLWMPIILKKYGQHSNRSSSKIDLVKMQLFPFYLKILPHLLWIRYTQEATSGLTLAKMLLHKWNILQVY